MFPGTFVAGAAQQNVMPLNMRKRKIPLYYLAFLLTGGQFAFLWLHLMAADIQHVKPNYILGLRFIRVYFVIAYFTYMALVGYIMYWLAQARERVPVIPPDYAPTYLLDLLAISLLAVTFFLAAKVVAFIRAQGVRLPNNFVLLLLVFTFGATFPLLQSKLNGLSQNNA